MNQVILVGRLANEVELKNVNVAEGEGVVTRFSLAVDNGRKGTDNDAYFFSCVAWNNLAKAIEKYVKKGDKLAVSGHLKPNNYKKENQKIYSTDVVVERVEFMNKPKKEEEGKSSQSGGTEGMLPPDDENVNRGIWKDAEGFQTPF